MNKRAHLLGTSRVLEIPAAFKPATLTIDYDSDVKGGEAYGFVSASNVGTVAPSYGAVMVAALRYAGETPDADSYSFICTFDTGYGRPGAMIYKNERYSNFEPSSEKTKRLYEDWKAHVGEKVEILLARESELGGVKDLIFLLQSLFWRLQHDEQRVAVDYGERIEGHTQNNCWYLPTPFYYFWMEQFVRFWGDCTTRNRGFSNHTTAVFKHEHFNNCFCQHRCSPVFKNNNYSTGQPKETYICSSFRIDLLCRRVFVSGRGCWKNNRPSNRSYIVSNATSFKEVAVC